MFVFVIALVNFSKVVIFLVQVPSYHLLTLDPHTSLPPSLPNVFFLTILINFFMVFSLFRMLFFFYRLIIVLYFYGLIIVLYLYLRVVFDLIEEYFIFIIDNVLNLLIHIILQIIKFQICFKIFIDNYLILI